MPPYEIIAIRHGETVENRNRIIQGHLPGRLTEKGKKQALEIGEILKNKFKIDIIISRSISKQMHFRLNVSLEY
jgi:broad specificity phosphatase PhoE